MVLGQFCCFSQVIWLRSQPLFALHRDAETRRRVDERCFLFQQAQEVLYSGGGMYLEIHWVELTSEEPTRWDSY